MARRALGYSSQRSTVTMVLECAKGLLWCGWENPLKITRPARRRFIDVWEFVEESKLLVTSSLTQREKFAESSTSTNPSRERYRIYCLHTYFEARMTANKTYIRIFSFTPICKNSPLELIRSWEKRLTKGSFLSSGCATTLKSQSIRSLSKSKCNIGTCLRIGRW